MTRQPLPDGRCWRRSRLAPSTPPMRSVSTPRASSVTPIPRIEAEAYERGCVAGMAMEKFAATPAPLYVEQAIQRVLDDRCRCGKVSAYRLKQLELGLK